MDIDELLESKQKYECMYWKKVHECNKLKQLLKDNGLGYHLGAMKVSCSTVGSGSCATVGSGSCATGSSTIVYSTRKLDNFSDNVNCLNEGKYSGTIIKLSQNLDYGFIKSDINSNLFFHISECKNFELDNSSLIKWLILH